MKLTVLFILTFITTFSDLCCKNVIILSCKGGGAHSSASKAISGYLKGQYNVKIVNVFNDILHNSDIIQRVSNKKYTCDDFYNFLLSKQQVQSINCMCYWIKYYLSFWPIKKSLHNAFYRYFQQHNPDLIISVIPLFNNIIAGVAKRLDVPFLVVPADLDSTHYTLSKENLDYSKFYYGTSFHNSSHSKYNVNHIRSESLVFLGFPLRDSFGSAPTKKFNNSRSVKQKFKIPENRKVVMILMGGAGSTASYKYAKAMANCKDCDLHVLICLGRDKSLVKRISSIKYPKNVSRTILGFTDKIQDLMLVSDILITAPGPTSIMESIHCHTPVVLDTTRGILNLHKFNVNFVKDNNLGDTVSSYNKLPAVINKLCCKNYSRTYKQSINAIEKSNPKVNIQNLVDSII